MTPAASSSGCVTDGGFHALERMAAMCSGACCGPTSTTAVQMTGPQPIGGSIGALSRWLHCSIEVVDIAAVVAVTP